MRARYYDPATGRFNQEDTHWNPSNSTYGDNPIQLAEHIYAPDIFAIKQSGNLYVYAMANPLLFIDPSGFKTIVFCYNNPGSGFADQVEDSFYFDSSSDDVIIIYVITAQDFIDAWNSLDDSDIDDIFLYLHGGEGKLYFKGEAMNMTGDKSLQSLLSKKVGGMVYLFSCHGGAGEEGNNVAWRFAELTGAHVRATASAVSYSQFLGRNHARVSGFNMFIPFVYWADYYYEEEDGRVVAKKRTYPSKWAW